ncbi:hypothetical protein DB30_04338 [Enhygromyxa salina]|uniref:Glycosyltransferase RgtA/B/C/D-like domain-containing protein n=1 Tax=Enhygromyxa salina TaxID=215803 RepID=A0A0C2D9A5_9BACT|nr:hypothetical protein [Enhygromyxa salina]KIG16567.1 hypothetical protein DB30_04338 [Enhygromyxa salina]
MKLGPDVTPRRRQPPSQLEYKRYLAFVLVVAVIGIALRGSAVYVGLMSDDFMQLGMLSGTYPGSHYAPFDLYAFLRRGELMVAHVEQGTAPWWSVPELHGTVFRPLASVLMWLDHAIAPGKVVIWHVHSMLWFGASIVALGLATRRLLPRSVAMLAVVLYACDAGMVSPLAWLANRCVLICATFGFLTVWAHVQWRDPDPHTPTWMHRRGGLLVGVLMAACISAGEYGLGIVAYLGAWELFVGHGQARQRLRGLVPALIPVLLYLLAHKLLGYGTFGAEVYADPFHTPSGYAKWATTRIPQLIASAFWSIPAATIHVFRFGLSAQLEQTFVPPDPTMQDYHSAHVQLAWWGIAAAIVVLLLARHAWYADERKALRALGVGAVLGMLPVAVAPPHSRLLIIAQLGVCAIVAAALVACVRLLLGRAGVAPLQSGAGSPVWPTRLRGLLLIPFAGLLAWLHTIGDVRWGNEYLRHLDELQAANVAAFTAGDLLSQPLEGRDVVILNGPSQSVGLYGEYVLQSLGQPMPATWRPLALGCDFPMVATRPADDTLELFVVQGSWMHTAGELFFRREDQPLWAGDVLEYPSLRVEILADDNGHPSRVLFRFDRSLDDPSFVFVVATKQGLQRWPVPARGGRNVVPLPRLPKAPPK